MSDFILSEDRKTLLGYSGQCPDEITIPDCIEVIAENAFAGRQNLKKVKFNSSVKTIMEGAFAKTAIQAVSLPASLNSLADYAFTYMTMGRQKYGKPYETPSALKINKKNAHYYTDDKCLYEIVDGALTLILCFKGSCNSLDVEHGTTRIMKRAFKYCQYLSSIDLPETLVTLDDGVFENLELETLKLPAKTTEIGESELSYLVDNIEYQSNSYNSTVSRYSTRITVDKGNPVYASEKNCFIRRDGEKATLLHVFDKYQEDFEFPSYISYIKDGAFRNHAKLKSIELPKCLLEIGADAFKGCTSLEVITVPASVKSIGAEAFSGCTKLRNVIFENGDICIAENAFDGCKKKQLFISCPIGSEVEKYAVSHKINLAGAAKADDPAAAFKYTVSKNKTVKISAYVSDEDRISIPASIEGCPVAAFTKDVFKNNKKIKSVVWPAEIPVLPKEIFFGCSSLEEIVLPEGITEISEKAFRNCEALTEIYIPSTVTAIHEKAFECAQNRPWGWEYWNCVNTIRGEVGSYAAEFAKSIGSNFVPSNASDEELDALRRYVFHEVPDGIALDDFVITNKTPASNLAFGGCGLISFEIPNEILGKPVVELSRGFHKKIKKAANNKEYEKIAETLVISENLKRIRCPLNSRGIQKVIVSPKNTALIFDDYAWYEDGGKTLGGHWIDSVLCVDQYTIREGTVCACSQLEQAFCLNKLFFPDSFIEVHKGFLTNGLWSSVHTIYANTSSCMKDYAEKNRIQFVALDSLDIVFSEDGLSLISCPQSYDAKQYTVPDGVRRIEKNAFKGNEYIEEIIIPDSVKCLGEGAFSKCKSLKKVELPSEIDELPDMLFFESRNLSAVKLPDRVEKIGRDCFAGTSLKQISIPETVVEIGDYAFAATRNGQNSIESIEIPRSVKSIGISICAGIKDITIFDSIDANAKLAKDYYDDTDGCWNSRVGCIGIRQRKGCLNAACNSEVFNHTITVRSAIDRSVKYKVLMYGEEEARNVYCAMVSSWGKNADFNFSRIDEKFSKLSDADNRLETVINRLTYPIDMTDEIKEKYHAWLKRNVEKIADKFIEKGDLFGLMSFEEYEIISKRNIQKLIELAVSRGKVEISAYLLEYSTRLTK